MASFGSQLAPLLVCPPPGPRSRQLAQRLADVECPAFEARRTSREAVSGADQAPIVYAQGDGANVMDVDGNRYVDLVAGFGALALGHAPETVLAATAAQSQRLGLALGDVYGSDVKAELLEELAAIYPKHGARVLLGTSGADAVSAALKTALLATGKARVLAFRGSYHGLSHGPLALCGLTESFRTPFASHLGIPSTFLEFPTLLEDLAALESSLQGAFSAGDVGAVLVEPILGRGGCLVPPPGFLALLRKECDRHGALLIADEVWTGFGRSGAWVRSLAEGVVPDLLCLGKALGGGAPISACVGSSEAMASWGQWGGTALHTATHFGAPSACASALATLRALRDHNLIERSRTVGMSFRQDLDRTLRGRGVRAVRGEGLMVGIHLEGGAKRALAVTRALLAHGYLVLTGASAGDVLTLTPALTISEALLREFVTVLATVLDEPSTK